MRLSRRLFPCLLLAATVLAPAAARAYPQWQFSTGVARCNVCHFAPGGGGLVTGYARDAVGSELSTIEGEGDFLHGAIKLPNRLAIGGDLRGALASQDMNESSGARTAIFPMQADLSARLVIWGGLSFTGIAGLRGQERGSQDFTPFQNYQPIYTSRLVSREHYFTWQPSPQGYYVRAGRFFAPFGLRLAEHTSYIRRDLGFNSFEETYNLSAGYVSSPWELHVTAFAPDVLRHIGSTESGATAYYERRLFNETAGLAGQVRYAHRPGGDRLIYGGLAKAWAAPLRTLFFLEGNLVHWSLDQAPPGNQFVGAGGFAVLPVPSVIVTLLAERNQEDLAVRATTYSAGSAILNWFPYPHLELQVLGQMQFPGITTPAKTIFAQVHYFL